MEIGEKVRAFRKARGWTQDELAKACGLNINSIRSYEQGRIKPKGDSIVKICNALGNCTPADFLPDPLIETVRQQNTMAQLGGLLTQVFEKSGTRTEPYSEEEIRAFIRISQAVRKMNAEGRREAAKRMEELAMLPKYTDSEDE